MLSKTSKKQALPPISSAATIADLRASAVNELTSHAIADPQRSADLLLCHVADLPQHALISHPHMTLTEHQQMSFWHAIERRASAEPVSRIIGRRAFWKDEFLVSPHTLDPRPDTEVIVACAIAHLNQLTRPPSRPLRILDIGTGTGCILLSILRDCPAAQGYGIDASIEAIETARKNASSLGLDDRCHLHHMSWNDLQTKALHASSPAPVPLHQIDLIVSNPPYISSAEIDTLAPEVTGYDPRLALDGGSDGLDAYRQITSVLAGSDFVGTLIFEIGAGQQADVAEILTRTKAQLVDNPGAETIDLGGHTRALIATFRKD